MELLGRGVSLLVFDQTALAQVHNSFWSARQTPFDGQENYKIFWLHFILFYSSKENIERKTVEKDLIKMWTRMVIAAIAKAAETRRYRANVVGPSATVQIIKKKHKILSNGI